MSTRPLTSTAVEMISEIRSVVLEEHNAHTTGKEVAGILERYLPVENLLDDTQCQPDASCYRQHVLHVEPGGTFSVVALVWLPGQVTPIHDHVSWCVVGTYRGEEEETAYRLDGNYLVPMAVNRTPQGVATFLTPPGDIHRVRNSTDGLAISIHVYGADISVLGSSIRRQYDLEVRPSDLDS